MKIENKVFVVTGASSGLGAATTQMLLAQGGKVAMVDMNREAGEALAQKLGENAVFAQADVADEAQAQAAIELATQRLGAVRGLINCAGVAPGERIVGRNGPHKLESFARTVQINLIGSFNMLRLAAAAMSEQEADEDGERGVVINTASVAAYDGQIGQAGYAASKAGIVGLTLPAARELARSAIRVMTIAPGIMETPMLMGMPQEVQDSLGQMVPFPSRLGKPAEYAALARHIIENSYLNGEVIRLDGSIRMAAK